MKSGKKVGNKVSQRLVDIAMATQRVCEEQKVVMKAQKARIQELEKELAEYRDKRSKGWTGRILRAFRRNAS